jgi:hypothetical protein
VHPVHDAILQLLQSGPDAEDDVVGARHPQRAVELESIMLGSHRIPRHKYLWKPIERIESLRSILRFRVPLGGNGMGKLRVVR